MVVITQQWMHGRPLYHTVDYGGQYSMLYGPFGYLWMSLVLKFFSDPILASKLSGAFWSMASLLLLLDVLRRRAGLLGALAGAGITALSLSYFEIVPPGLREPLPTIPVWDRNDPLLLFSSCLCLYALVLQRRALAGLLIALGMAMAISCKVHAVLYSIPILTIWFYRNGWKPTLLVMVLGGVLSLVPFALPNVSLGNYLLQLKQAGAHPLRIRVFYENISMFLLVLAPLLLWAGRIALPFARSKVNETTLLFAAILVSGILLSIPASKAGGGPWHYIPFFPYIAYLFCLCLERRPQSIRPTVMTVLAVLFVLFAYLNCLKVTRNLWKFCKSPTSLELQLADLRHVLAKYPAADTQMGAGDIDNYQSTNVVPALYQAGQLCVVNIGSYMDMDESGIDSAPLKDSLEKEAFRYWLIPKGDAPFSMISLYWPQHPLFDESVGRTFLEHYAKVDSSEYFDIYQAKTVAP